MRVKCALRRHVHVSGSMQKVRSGTIIPQDSFKKAFSFECSTGKFRTSKEQSSDCIKVKSIKIRHQGHQDSLGSSRRTACEINYEYSRHIVNKGVYRERVASPYKRIDVEAQLGMLCMFQVEVFSRGPHTCICSQRDNQQKT